MNILKTALGLSLILLASLSSAQDEAKMKIIENLAAAGLAMDESQVSESPIAGYYQATVVSGGGETIIYLSEDGQYFFAGDLFFLEPDRFVNATEAAKSLQRAEALAAVDTDSMIIFPAVGEVKGVLSVFTDVTCGYCRKLHEQIDEMNTAGIEVHYLAYPRSGIERNGVYTREFTETVKAWCAEDREEVMTQLKAGLTVEGEVCDENPVAEHYALGREFGVTGTPAIVLEDGSLVPGYRTTEGFLQLLGVE